MPLIARETGSDFMPAPAGTHIARCIWVIALGTQPSGNPQFMDSYKILIAWELPEELITYQGEEKPLICHKEYTLSLSEKALLRKDLESWRARQFRPEEKAGFDVKKVASVPCFVSITHKISGKGKTYAQVSAVSALTRGTICKPQYHPTLVYEIEDGNSDTYRKLPEWIQKKIQNSEEAKSPAPVTQPTPEPEGEEFDDSSLPF